MHYAQCRRKPERVFPPPLKKDINFPQFYGYLFLVVTV